MAKQLVGSEAMGKMRHWWLPGVRRPEYNTNNETTNINSCILFVRIKTKSEQKKQKKNKIYIYLI